MIERLNKLKINAALCLILLISSSAYAQIPLGNIPSGTAIIMSVDRGDAPPSAENTEWGTRHYKMSRHARHGTVSILDSLAGIVQYKSAPGFVGSDSFTLSYQDKNTPDGEINFNFEVTDSAVYQVTTTENFNDGVCDSHCSVNDAINAANANPGKDVIYLSMVNLDYSIFQPEVITDDVIISGEYDPLSYGLGTSIFGTLNDSGFRVEGAHLDLYHLRFFGGTFISGASPYITLYNVDVSYSYGFNSNSFGGEFAGVGGMLAFESKFENYHCGAVLMAVGITASRIKVSGGSGGSCSPFAAIATQAYSNSSRDYGRYVKVFSSSIYDNESAGDGLIAVRPEDPRTQLSLVNTSIHNNYNGTPSPAVVSMWDVDAKIVNSSFVDNGQAPSLSVTERSSVILVNNLFANNGEQECVEGRYNNGPGWASSITSYGNNLYTSNSNRDCGSHALDITVDSFVDYFRDYGGYYEFIQPYDSQANDSANGDYCPHVDISGLQRPADGDKDGVFQCDIGAAELNAEWLALDIMANGSAGFVEISSLSSLAVTLSLETHQAHQVAPRQAEWWLSASTPMGLYYFDSTQNEWLPGVGLSYQGAIFTMTDFPALSTSGLPSGDYRFHFDIDTTLDGLKDNASIGALLEVSILP